MTIVLRPESRHIKKPFPIQQLAATLIAIRPKISVPQMSMLRAHYLYRTLSMERIANFGGYDNYRAGNSQYGTLCGRIARKLGYSAPGDQTGTIATVSPERDRKGAYQWQMDPTVVKALEKTGWFSQISEEKPEPKGTREVTETEREALIEARVGQGIFRTDVIALWGSCAITGCTLSSPHYS